MKYLVDTDWTADYLNGRPNTIQALTAFARDGLGISLITYGEIYDGIYHGRNARGAERAFRQFLRMCDVLPLTRVIMRRYARIRGDLRATGQRLGDPDVLIAATALHHGLILLTRNHSHFQRIPSLQLHTPGRT
jgi:predicted nucleic acid-binding protein